MPTVVLWCLVVLVVTSGQASARDANAPEAEDPLLVSLREVLVGKMAEARDVILHGAGPLASMDPFKLPPLELTVREAKGFANVSLSKVVVEGLGNFQLKEVVTNMDVFRTSMLLSFPDVRVTAAYKLKGYLNSPLSQSLTSEGRYETRVGGASASWVGRVEHKDASLTLTQESFRTHWEHAQDYFTSFIKKNNQVLLQAKELLEAVGQALLEKVRKLAEEGLERALAHVMGRAKQPHSWFEMYPPAPPLDTTPLVYERDFEMLAETAPLKILREGPQPQQPPRGPRRKRQVPCENGEGLDEYVDTLLRFGRRLIRFQEPLPFPNTTIKVDDMLTVFLYNGGIRGASNISRKKNAYVKCTNTSTTLGLVVRIENFRLSAKYRVLQDYRLLLFNGEADVRASEVIALAQLTQTTLPNGETRQSLDRLKIWKLGRVTVRMRGLGNLTSALSMLLTYQINEDPKAVIPVVEAQVTHVIRQQLNNITIPIFSII